MGGAQQLVYELSKRINSSGGSVAIFTGLSHPSKSLSAKDNFILDKVICENIPHEIIQTLNDRISFINDLKSLISIYRLLRIYKPSVVHIHSSKTGILGRLACYFLGINNVIYHVHGWSFSREMGLKNRIYFYLEKIFYFFTNKYIFVCKQDRTDFIKMGGNHNIIYKSTIIYPGASFLNDELQMQHREKIRKKLGFNNSDFVIGTVARIDHQKNPIIFIKIANNYSSLDDNVKFLWIGKGPLESEMNNKIKKLDLEDKFLLPGYINNVEPYFSVFDVFLITSKYEGLPVTALKAIACGIPIVGFNINGICDLSIMFNSCFGVNPFDIDEFVSKIIEAKKFSIKQKKLIKKDSSYIRKTFSLESMYDKITMVYDFNK